MGKQLRGEMLPALDRIASLQNVGARDQVLRQLKVLVVHIREKQTGE